MHYPPKVTITDNCFATDFLFSHRSDFKSAGLKVTIVAYREYILLYNSWCKYSCFTIKFALQIETLDSCLLHLMQSYEHFIKILKPPLIKESEYSRLSRTSCGLLINFVRLCHWYICLLKSDIIVNIFRITNNMSCINSHQVLNGSKFSTKNHKLWIHLHINDIERKHLNKITCHTAAPDHWINIYLPSSVRLNSNLLIMPTYYIIP